jgi:hypothetical protein
MNQNHKIRHAFVTLDSEGKKVKETISYYDIKTGKIEVEENHD